VLAVLVALTLSLGFAGPSTAGQSTTPDTAAVAGASASQDGQVSAERSAPCAAKAQALKHTQKKVKKAKRHLKKTQKALKRAKAHKGKKAQKKAHHKVTKAKRHLKKAKNQRRHANQALKTCRKNHNPKPAPAPESPIQALCDAGAPQPLCDALGAIPVPGAPEGGGTDAPIQPVCDAVPELQPLCDAAGGGPLPDPSTVCDALPVPLPLCDLPDIPGLPLSAAR
jgi:hypothetical protein